MTDEPLMTRFRNYKATLDAEGQWSPDALRTFLNREGIDDRIIAETNDEFGSRMLGPNEGTHGNPGPLPEPETGSVRNNMRVKEFNIWDEIQSWFE